MPKTLKIPKICFQPVRLRVRGSVKVLAALLFIAAFVRAADKNDRVSEPPPEMTRRQTHKAVSTIEREGKLRANIQHYRTVGARAPGTAEGKEATMKEVEALVALGGRANGSDKIRRRELVENVRTDRTIPEERRFGLVAAVSNAEVAMDTALNRQQKLASFATVARTLVQQFPEQYEAYASLFRIARDSDEKAAKQIALELVRLPGTPAQVLQGAQMLLRRLELIGTSLDKQFGEATQKASKNRSATCIYSWSVASPRSILLGSTLQKLAPDGTRLIAVCIDTNVALARESASKIGVVGDDIIYPEGLSSEICQKLCIDEPGLAYLTDEDNKFVTVSAVDWLRDSKKTVHNR